MQDDTEARTSFDRWLTFFLSSVSESRPAADQPVQASRVAPSKSCFLNRHELGDSLSL